MLTKFRLRSLTEKKEHLKKESEGSETGGNRGSSYFVSINYVRHCAEHFTHTILFNSHDPHSRGEKPEAQVHHLLKSSRKRIQNKAI